MSKKAHKGDLLLVDRPDEWWSRFGRYSLLKDRYSTIEWLLEQVRHQPFEATMEIAYTRQRSAPRAADYHALQARFEQTLSAARADFAKAEAMALELEAIYADMRKLRPQLGISIDDNGRELMDGVPMTRVLLGEHKL